MTLRVVGAGFGRTGTHSLKLALEKLLAAPCYHMVEVFMHPEHVPAWHDAALGKPVDWDALFKGYAAAVDWPTCAYWPELMKVFPDALVLFSARDTESWWESASQTIMHTSINDHPMTTPEWRAMMESMFANQGIDTEFTREAAIAAFEANTARVLREVPRERLLVWKAGDGWEPICKALGLPVPGEPFPRSNTREDWRAREAAEAASH